MPAQDDIHQVPLARHQRGGCCPSTSLSTPSVIADHPLAADPVVGVHQQHDAILALGHQQHMGVEGGRVAAMPDHRDAVARAGEPAHAVAPLVEARQRPVWYRDGAALQLGDACGREDRRAAVAPAIELGDQVVRHIFGAGHQQAGGQELAVEGRVEGDRPAKPVAVAGSQAGPARPAGSVNACCIASGAKMCCST